MSPFAHFVRSCLRLHVEVMAGRGQGMVAEDLRFAARLEPGLWPQLSAEERAVGHQLLDTLGLRHESHPTSSR